MTTDVRGFVDIAKRSVVQGRDELNGKVMSRPALVITDGDALTYAVDVDIGNSAPGGLVSDGQWNAESNSPGLPAPSRENDGHYYRVIVAGWHNGVHYSVGDWVISSGEHWYRETNLTELLKNVPLARANLDLMYADAGNPCRLRRTASGQWEVVGFSKEMPGTYTRFPVSLTTMDFGLVEDLGYEGRPLTYDELAAFGGYGTVPYGAVGLFQGGVLREIK